MSTHLEQVDQHESRNAIILAAGTATRFAPLSFEKPKALFTIRGEVLIERLIRQLRYSGIKEIILVVGHMKEQFFYLEKKFDIVIVENPSYSDRNNNSSLYAARKYLGDSYVCPSDQYYLSNPFSPHENTSYCSTMFHSRTPRNWVVHSDENGRIVNFKKSGGQGWRPQGPSFITKDFARTYLQILEEEYDLPETIGKLWEEVALSHLDQLVLFEKKLPKDALFEFDYISDCCAFDPRFIENVDSTIFDNICKTLSCDRSAISNVVPLEEGITNLSAVFTCNNVQYVYRHPGAGTNEIINRQAEALALSIASKIGLDPTYIHADPISGWKISKFIPDCESFDYRNKNHVTLAIDAMRRLHGSEEKSPWHFDFYDEARRIQRLLEKEKGTLPQDYRELSSLISSLSDKTRIGKGEEVLCHNDFYGPNLLVKNGHLALIDWEYSAMGDYGYDLGNFIAQGSGYSIDEALETLSLYLNRRATPEERFHLIACTAIVGWYWYVWGLFKESKGSSVGEWLRTWHDAAVEYGSYAIRLIRSVEPQKALSREAFDILTAAEEGNLQTIKRSDILSELEKQGLINKGRITLSGIAALEPYRVRRAVLLASGLGSRMAPITINTPKPLARVNGKRIIDSILDALYAIDVKEIYIVRGYLKEQFDTLLKKYPTVRFIDNDNFASTNNISSALLACDHFENAYVSEADFYIKNPWFVKKYQYDSNYIGVPVEETDDWCFSSEDNYILNLKKGGNSKEHSCHHMFAFSHWTKEDAQKLSHDIPAAFNNDLNKQRFWDDVPCVLKKERYKIRIRNCSFDDILEIDSFHELQKADPSYLISS